MSYIIPPGSHKIPYDEAYTMIERYQTNVDKMLNPELMTSKCMPRSETFRKEEILKYLSQPEIEYFRIYLGMKPNMDLHTILVGVDKDGHDLLPKEGLGHVPPGTIPPGDDPDPDAPAIFEDALRCPSYCPPEDGCFLFPTPQQS
jgi:hypothetical protein